MVAAMLELMEKLQAGAPAASEQLFSSCRYPRASENSLGWETAGCEGRQQGSWESWGMLVLPACPQSTA